MTLDEKRAIEDHGPCETCGAAARAECWTKGAQAAKVPHKPRVVAYERHLLAQQADQERRLAESRVRPPCLGAQRASAGGHLPAWTDTADGLGYATVPPGVPIFLTGDQAGPHGRVEMADAYSVAIIDSALNVRTYESVTMPSIFHEQAREWAAGQTDVLFARYVVDGVEHIGWPIRGGIEWKETVPA